MQIVARVSVTFALLGPVFAWCLVCKRWSMDVVGCWYYYGPFPCLSNSGLSSCRSNYDSVRCWSNYGALLEIGP